MDDQEIQKKLVELLGDEVEERIRTTIDTLNLRVREKIKESTGLRLSHGERTERIPIKVVPDLPDTFLPILRPIPEDLLPWLFQNSESLHRTLQTLQTIHGHFWAIEKSLKPESPLGSDHELVNVIALIEQLINWKKQFPWPTILDPTSEPRTEVPPWSGEEDGPTISGSQLHEPMVEAG